MPLPAKHHRRSNDPAPERCKSSPTPHCRTTYIRTLYSSNRRGAAREGWRGCTGCVPRLGCELGRPVGRENEGALPSEFPSLPIFPDTSSCLGSITTYLGETQDAVCADGSRPSQGPILAAIIPRPNPNWSFCWCRRNVAFGRMLLLAEGFLPAVHSSTPGPATFDYYCTVVVLFPRPAQLVDGMVGRAVLIKMYCITSWG
jgi:hypothetical protein